MSELPTPTSATPPPPSRPSLRARLIVGGIVGVPLLAIILGVALLAGSAGPAPTPSPSGSPDPSATPSPTAPALVAARCQTVPIDAAFAFGTLPLPPGARSTGPVAAAQGTAYVAERFEVTWPEGGFAAWVERDLGEWQLAGTLFADGTAATLARTGEDIEPTFALLTAEGETGVVVEVPAIAVETARPVTPLTPLSLLRAGEADACAPLSGYILVDGDGGPALALDLAGFVARPVGGGPEVSTGATNPALRPVRLPDGGWRIPLEVGVSYRLLYTYEGQLAPLYNIAGKGTGVCDDLIVEAPSDRITDRLILRLDARRSEVDKGRCGAGDDIGLFAELERQAIRTPDRAEVIVPELNGLAVAVLLAETLRYRPELIAAIEAIDRARDAAGFIGTLLFWMGIGSGVLTGAFALYVSVFMDKRRTPRPTGRGLVRPVRGRR